MVDSDQHSEYMAGYRRSESSSPGMSCKQCVSVVSTSCRLSLRFLSIGQTTLWLAIYVPRPMYVCIYPALYSMSRQQPIYKPEATVVVQLDGV